MGLVGMLLYMALMVGIFWFILIRPQRKEKKKLAAMLQTLEIGDVVLTTSGFYGVLIDIKDDMVIVEFGNNKNCRIPMEKGARRTRVKTAAVCSAYGNLKPLFFSWLRRSK